MRENPSILYAVEYGIPCKINFISANCESITGYKLEQFLSDPVFFASKVHPEDIDRSHEEFAAQIPTGKGVIEFRFRYAYGSYLWIRERFKAITTGDDTYELIGSWANISDKKEVEQKAERLVSRGQSTQ